jgi:ubiquinone/menaquinone biosynthesis C-methylase UbiE
MTGEENNDMHILRIQNKEDQRMTRRHLVMILTVIICIGTIAPTTFAQGKTEQAADKVAGPPRSGVPKGINDNFLNPDLDPAKWVKRFEIESRDVFAGRAAILKAINIQPGYRIADVGSGTGLYVAPFSRAVGETGMVFAIDISPKLIEFVRQRAARESLTNVTVTQSTEQSITLPADSVDRVFICDTYHHFEYHTAMLESIRTAMRPDAELILVDFEKIPGKSRDFIMGHVRAGKDVVSAEVQEAGFELIEEVTIPEFKENYLLRFRRRADK